MTESSALVDVIKTAAAWRSTGQRVVLARVVGVSGSAPQPPGTSMAISEDGTVIGSLSGGCVEASVIDAAQRLLAGADSLVMPFDWGDEDAYEMGLSCGGRIDVLLSKEPLSDEAANAFGSDASFTMATLVDGLDSATTIGSSRATLLVDAAGAIHGTLGDVALDTEAVRLGHETHASGDPWHNGLHRITTPQGDVTVFVEAHHPRPLLLISGAADVTAAALARLARFIGFKTVVCDPRSVFTTETRLPEVDELIIGRAESYIEAHSDQLGPGDALAVLTHRFSFDIPVIQAALKTGIGYIGALGSRGTAEQRRGHLIDQGTDEADLQRLHAPIGLNIGANTPEEVALAILAEIVANRGGADGSALHKGTGPIHARRRR